MRGLQSYPVLLTDTYPLPRSEDLFAALAGGKIFSKLDLKNAYLQIPLDEASKKYTTINTPKGLFQYERLPFGVSSAPSLFQRTIDNLLSQSLHMQKKQGRVEYSPVCLLVSLSPPCIFLCTFVETYGLLHQSFHSVA